MVGHWSWNSKRKVRILLVGDKTLSKNRSETVKFFNKVQGWYNINSPNKAVIERKVGQNLQLAYQACTAIFFHVL